jgi:monoamine oxidase
MPTRRHFLLGSAVLMAPTTLHAKARMPPFDVIVIGAGLAGLQAALSAEKAGLGVQVLEARDRVGGRLYTLTREGQTFDVGAVEVGESYARIRTWAQQLGVELKASTAKPVAGQVIHFDGENIAVGDWPNHRRNPLPENLRETPPGLLLYQWLQADRRVATAHAALNGQHADLDISLHDYLLAQNISEQALRLADVAANYNDLRNVSALDVLRRDALRKVAGQTGGTLGVVGGSQKIPNAMATRLTSPVALNQAVTSVTREGPKNYAVTTNQGQTLHARSVVVAIPAPLIAGISFHPALPDSVHQLFAARTYTAVTTIHLQPLEPFWQADGLSPNMWIDGPLERLFAVPNADGPIQRLIVWINGRGALALDHLSEQQIGEYVLLELARIRPSTRGKLRVLAIKSWSADPFALGAYAEMGVGQAQACYQNTAALYEKLPKDLAFAGEHLQFALPGMEAALASGEEAASRLLSLLR